MNNKRKIITKSCVPCQKGTTPLSGEQLTALFSQLENGWQIIKDHQLEREYHFPDFATALAFTNQVGALAEKEGHHPDIHLSYGKVKIILWTHKIDGLSENDFIFAAKCGKIIHSACKN